MKYSTLVTTAPHQPTLSLRWTPAHSSTESWLVD